MGRKKKNTGEAGPRSKEGASGNAQPENIGVPKEALIQRKAPEENAGDESASVKVKGNQRLLVMDDMHKAPVEVVVVEGQHLNPKSSGKLVFVFGAVSNDFCTEAQARAKFAQQKDGTVIYNARGFDDVRATADFNLVDIVKLVELNADDE